MGRKDVYGPQLQRLCSVPLGRSLPELLPLCAAAKATLLYKLPAMVSAGELHRGGTRRNYRYFTHRADLIQWTKAQFDQAAAAAAAGPRLDPRDRHTLAIERACSAPTGATLPDIARATGASLGTLGGKLPKLVEAGRLLRRGTPRTYRYFTLLAHAQAWDRGEAPPPVQPTQSQAKPARTRKHGAPITIKGSKARAAGDIRLAEAATVTIPAHVQIQRAPTPRDDRFTFTPPPGWKGELTREWEQRRRA